jgi:hypothetical protein
VVAPPAWDPELPAVEPVLVVAPVDDPVEPLSGEAEPAGSRVPRTSTRELTYCCSSLGWPPSSVNELPAPPAVVPVAAAAVEDPVVEPAAAAGDPAGEPALPDGEPVAPVLEPGAPGVELEGEPIAPLLDAPVETLAFVSMKPPLPLGELMLPAVPVVPVALAPDALLPAPEPDTRHPVTTTA